MAIGSQGREPFWIPIAKSLKFGQKRKIKCCGKDPSMIVSHGKQGYSAHCFRSPDHGGFVSHSRELTLKQLEQRQRDRQELRDNPSVSLPADALSMLHETVPAEPKLWLLRSGLSLHLSSLYGIVYSPRYRRVFVPVYTSTGVFNGWIARSPYGEKPKYLLKVLDPNICFRSKSELKLSSLRCDKYDLVIVEDVLSAIRVGRSIDAVSVLGTTVRGKELDVLYGFPPGSTPSVAVWLDGDKAGRKGRENIARSLTLLGAEVSRINTPKDPKYYSNREIRSILCD